MHAIIPFHFIAKVTKLNDHEKELNMQIRNQSVEISELNSQIISLEKVKKDYISSLLDAKKSNEQYNEKRAELERKIRAEDKISRLKEITDVRQQWIRDQSLERDHEVFKQRKAIEIAITDNENKKNNMKLKEILANSTDFKRPKKSSSSQTGEITLLKCLFIALHAHICIEMHLVVFTCTTYIHTYMSSFTIT